MELNKEQVIKSLECCKSEGHICYKCSYRDVRIGISCRDKLSRDALDLIKELTEENESWQKQLIATEEKSGKAYYDLACEVENLRGENDNLHATCTELTRKCASLTEENEGQVDTNLKLVAENVMFMLDKTIEDINKIGAVRHGHWISENRRPKSYQFRCSVCDGVTYYLHRNEKGEKQCLYKYCPHCGAKMEIEEGEI